jgi:hypothetical protein
MNNKFRKVSIMKLFTTIIFFITFSEIFAQNLCASSGQRPLSDLEAIGRSQFEDIEEDAEFRNVSQDIDNLISGSEWVASEYSISANDFISTVVPGGHIQLERLRNRGYDNGARTLVDVIEADAELGDISAPLAELRRLAELQGKDIGHYIDSDRLASLTATANANANNRRSQCGEANHAAALGAVRNQDSVGWCVSFTMADLIGHRTGRRISAFDVARRHYNRGYHDSVRDLTRGSGNDLMPRVMGIPYTRAIGGYWTGMRATFFTALSIGLRDDPRSVADSLDDGVASVEPMLEAVQSYNGICSEESFPSQDYSLGNIECLITQYGEGVDGIENPCQNLDILNQLFPGGEIDDLNQISTLATIDEAIDTFGTRCQSDVSDEQLDNLTTSYIEALPSRRNMLDGVLRSLDSGPVGIAVNHDFLETNRFSPTHINDEGGHVVSAVAKKWDENTNSCMVLIRNSWGEDYTGEQAGWTHDPDYPGHVWVTEQALFRNLRKGFTVNER